MLSYPLRGTRCASLIAASMLIACGDDAPSNTTETDTVDQTDGSDTADSVDTDALDPDTTDTDTVADVTDTDTITDATDTADTDTTTADVTDDTDTVQPSPPTATVVIDGVATAVTPSVRRGFVYTQAAQRGASSPLHSTTQMSCEGSGGGLTEGGRIINPTSVTIVGNFGSTCDPGGSGENFRIGEQQMLYAARQSCGGRTGSCSHDFSESFLLRFGSCSYSSVYFSVQYNCEALFPGPSYLVEVPTSYGLLRAEGLDGLGEMGCEQRAASFRLDGQPVTIGEGTCKVTIGERSPTLLSGRIEATLSLGGSDRQVVIDFGSRETETRTTLLAFFQDDLCATNSITATVETEGTDTFDVFETAPLACQANPQRTVDPITVSIRRPRTNEANDASTLEARTTISQGAYAFSGYSRFYSIDDSATRVRLAAYEVAPCQDEALQTCLPPLPVLYFQGTK